MQLPDAPHRLYWSARVPASLLEAFQPRKKQICVLEVLWVILAIIIWQDTLLDAFVVIFDDNTGAERGLSKGISRHADINILLSAFWCSIAELRAQAWFEHIASSDNPADCLTKPHLDVSHLVNDVAVSDSIDWESIFKQLSKLLRSKHVPSWEDTQCLLSSQDPTQKFQ